jgi:hypothetical protein
MIFPKKTTFGVKKCFWDNPHNTSNTNQAYSTLYNYHTVTTLTIHANGTRNARGCHELKQFCVMLRSVVFGCVMPCYAV